MTIVVSVQCSEGIVLAADSAIAIFSGGSAIRVWPHAKKVSHVGTSNIGVLSFGLGALGNRNIQSLMYEFEVTGRAKPGVKWDVAATAQALHSFLVEKYREVFGQEKDPTATLGMIVAGYSEGAFEPQQYRFKLPFDSAPKPITFAPFRVGIAYDGLPDPIYRLVHGLDAKLAVALSKVAFSQEQLLQLAEALAARQHDEERIASFLAGMQGEPTEFDRFLAWKELLSYGIVLEGMPLQDGIDLASWLIEATIGSYRFAEDWPLAGGAIDVAVITHAHYTWIQRKSWHGYNRRPAHFPEGGSQ